jgi:RsiW-degrading membrane proteinase PrsW (M82 family)
MITLAAAEDLLLLVLVALVPSLTYLSWVRKGERFRAEGWSTLLAAFGYGALFATFAAGFLELAVLALGSSVAQRFPGPEFVFLQNGSAASVFFLVLVVAPFVEEALKASGVYSQRAALKQVADGPVVGAASGLGFGFFETFLYGVGAFLTGGLAAGLTLVLVRSVSSVLLHGSSTGMFGYGFARSRFGFPAPGSGSYYLLAVGMHSAFNALASIGVILAVLGIGGLEADAASLVGLLAAIAFAIGAIEHVRSVVAAASYPALLRPPPQPRKPTR